jgi:hypothetical protein
MSTNTSPERVLTFLLLPLEIRERIYHHLLQLGIQSASPTTNQAGPRSHCCYESYCRSQISYQLNALPGIVPTLGLLRCCRQTRSELQQLITRQDKNNDKDPLFVLDCILERDLISPTWIILPNSLEFVHRLEINIRVFYLCPRNFFGRQDRVVLFPRIFDLLYQLLNAGPHFYRRNNQSPPIFIKTLILKFLDHHTKQEKQQQTSNNGLNATMDLPPMSLQRIEECILGLNRYRVLRGKVETIRIQSSDYFKEIQVNGPTISHKRIATSGEWLSWVYRWPSDAKFDLLDK